MQRVPVRNVSCRARTMNRVDAKQKDAKLEPEPDVIKQAALKDVLLLQPHTSCARTCNLIILYTTKKIKRRDLISLTLLDQMKTRKPPYHHKK